MARGKVKWFNEPKGYGFILPSEGGRDIFFHHSVISKQNGRRVRVKENDEVEFSLKETDRGPQAASVRLA